MTGVLTPQIDRIDRIDTHVVTGRVTDVTGLTVCVSDLHLPVGAMCRLCRNDGSDTIGSVIGLRGESAIVMPLDDTRGISTGDRVKSICAHPTIRVGPELMGRVIDGMGNVIDERGPLRCAEQVPVYADAPPALSRRPIEEPIGTGIRSLDALLTAGRGQRLGIFSGTGVGKSILLAMMARYTDADCLVVALIGERGREVGDFLKRTLGDEGLRRSVVVVATSDQSPVLRVRACYTATAVAEYFRDQGKNVLLLMDSLTRMAMAQRQIGLASGEPPTTKGYPPSVFALLPGLLERSGRTEKGSITGIYSVLVEADDLTEPISDAVRGILDGHIWLSRKMANRRHYPAISPLESISRVMPDITDAEQQNAAKRVQQVLGTWEEIEDLVNIGAYTPGSNPEFDLTIRMKPRIDAFLQQGMNERVGFEEAKTELLALAKEIESVAAELGKDNADTKRN